VSSEDGPPRSRLPPAVYWFGATSLSNDFASEIIYPLLPAFVTSLGGGPLALGILDGIAEAVASFFKLVSGYLAERPRLRGRLVVAGYAIASAIRPLIAMAAAAWHVVFLRAVDRLGKGLRTAPRDVMIADVTEETMRGRAFGVHRAADHTGAIAGPLLASALVAWGLGVRQVFWVAAIPGAVTVVLAWLAVRKAVPALSTDAVPGLKDTAAVFTRAASARAAAPPVVVAPEPGTPAPTRPRGLGALVVILAIAALLRAPETLLILRAQDLGIAVTAVPLLWAALHVVRSLASVPGGTLADRWGPRRTLAVGWLLYAALAWAFGAAHGVHAAWSIFLAFGVVTALTESPERKLVAALAPGVRRGRGFGWYHALISAVALPGAAFFGWLYQSRGASTAFAASAGATLAAALLLAVAGRGLSRSAWFPPGARRCAACRWFSSG
jgi:MFS family permease